MSNTSSGKSLGFVVASTMAHIALATAVISMQVQTPQPEVMEVEIQGESLEMPQAAMAPVTAPTSLEPSSPALPAKTEVVPEVTKTPPQPKQQVPAVLPVAQKAPVQAIEEAPTQEESPVAAPVAEELSPAQSSDEALAQSQEALDEEALRQQQEQAAAAALAAQKEQEKIANEKAAEQAAAEQARLEAEKKSQEEALLAQQKAEQEAKAQEAAAALEQAKAQEAAAAALAAQQAQAGADQGVAQAESQAPIGNSVRDISELKQIPGNKRPQYDSEDRLRRRQGEVSFMAYISRDGKAVQFKMVKSSGHRELDSKTFKAIRDWKFYPGQEGWVEIPFKWDLKGGAQEAPATLRRKVSQN